MNEFYRKLATLSPERRALFEQKLADRGLSDNGPGARSRTAIRPRPPGLTDLPLSSAQRRLWFIQRLDPDSTAYNMTTVLRLGGPLDRAALGRAVEALVRRHEPLRTRFKPGDHGEPRQVIDPAGPIPIDIDDLSASSDPETEARLRIEDLAATPFDLAGPPLRVRLIRLGADRHLLAFGLHHISGDRWSMTVFVRDLAELYAAAVADRDPVLADLPVQYADWALWQAEDLAGDRLADQLGYWTERLTGPLPVLDLPFDRPRGAVAGHGGGRHPVALDRDLALRLRELARRRGVSLFTLLLAGFKTLLHLVTDSDDIVVGSEVANRDRPETQGMVGPLVNTLVLRSDLAGDPDFGALLTRVDETVRGGLARQDVPFERIVEALNPERRLGEMTPLFQAKFDLQHTVFAATAPGDLSLERYPFEERAAKYELRFNLEDSGEDIAGRIEYASDLFDAPTIARLACWYERLLGQIVADPARRLSTLALLSPDETRAAIAAAAGPALAMPDAATIHDLVAAQAARIPQRPP
ncbi:condensation domain-containing protein [Methylobrevis pamukkalensis]|uniref:Linear gramicidin synthase subunit B n=1 Tax=Methylobrevis pamukkalensis TaxID=1439726 RepID=A0A1E3H754_9HYPH|nr:condensation domain-containing protein [Methylobrevis pamukkalensis]ODN72169.1 Linear gramicidin synthase subunit B [Methylobrevis pamukkalensis]